MGIYIFNTQLLIPILIADAEDPHSSHDFGRDILPKIISKYRIYANNFVHKNKTGPPYGRDVGPTDANYEPNMDLVSVRPVFNLYENQWQRPTGQQQNPAASLA